MARLGVIAKAQTGSTATRVLGQTVEDQRRGYGEGTPMFGWGTKTITTDELAEKMKAGKVVLIDVREPSEFAGGRIPGAINIPLGRLREGVGKYDPSRRDLPDLCQRQPERNCCATAQGTRIHRRV